MKTIEERAKEYSKGQWDVPTALKAYIAGATEQKAIDDAERVNQALMGKGSAINYYQQGFHDAVERAKTAFGKPVYVHLPVLLAIFGITNSLRVL